MKLTGKRFILMSLMVMAALIFSACTDANTVEPDIVTAPVVEDPAVEDPVVEDPAVVEDPEVVEDPAVVDEPQDPLGPSVGVVGAEADYMMLASALLDRDVASQAGEDIGEIEDFLIDLSTGNVPFALVEHGGFLSLFEQDAPIPLSAFSVVPGEDELILGVTQEQFETFPDIEVGDDWPFGLEPGWDTDLRGFWTNAGFNVSDLGVADENLVVRASNLIGYGWGAGAPAAGVATTAASIGNINDYIVDLGQGRVEYAVLSFVDVGVYGEDWVIVPFQAIEPGPLGTEIRLDPAISPELLTAAPRIVGATLGTAEFFAPGWDEQIRAYWSEQGYDLDQPATGATDAPAVEATPTQAATGAVIPGTTDTTGQAFGVTGAEEDYMLLASALLDSDVDNLAGEDLGEIDDFLVDVSNGNVLYVLVAHGGFLGIAQDQVAVPLTAFNVIPGQDDLILNVNEEVFETFPDTEIDDTWPTGLGAGWDTDLRTFWTNTGFNVSGIEGADANAVIRGSELAGMGFGLGGDETAIGDVEDYIIDMSQGSIEYALMSAEDASLFGEDWAIVPFDAVNWAVTTTGEPMWMVDDNLGNDAFIGAPRVNVDQFGDASYLSPGWDEDVRTYWGGQGYQFD